MKNDFLMLMSDKNLKKLYDLIGQVNHLLNPEELSLTTLYAFDMHVALHFAIFDLDVIAELMRRERAKKND